MAIVDGTLTRNYYVRRPINVRPILQGLKSYKNTLDAGAAGDSPW